MLWYSRTRVRRSRSGKVVSSYRLIDQVDAWFGSCNQYSVSINVENKLWCLSSQTLKNEELNKVRKPWFILFFDMLIVWWYMGQKCFFNIPSNPNLGESWMTYYTGQVVNLLGTCHGLKYLRPTQLGMHPVMGGPKPLETAGWPVAKNWLPKHNGLQGDTSSHHVLTFSSSVPQAPGEMAEPCTSEIIRWG